MKKLFVKLFFVATFGFCIPVVNAEQGWIVSAKVMVELMLV